MRRSFRFLAILACAMPLACADTSKTPTATAPAPSLSANPASNGAILVRYDDTGNYWVGWYDSGKNLLAVHTTFDLAAFCAGENGTLTSISWQVVVSGKFAALYQVVGKVPEAFIFIYEGGWETWSGCKPPIMSGTGRLMHIDNDWTGMAARANAYGMMATGQVTDADGQLYQYSGHVRGVTSQEGSNREEISVNVKPVQ